MQGTETGRTALEHEIVASIEADGPMSLAHYMALCLGHPQHGYYATRDPFGAAGDFTTAPEISQMFGELIGLWAVDAWQRNGAPDPFALVELGPGRGTLMSDALRAARVVPVFLAAVEIHLVETSRVLRERQKTTLQTTGKPIIWHDDLGTVPDLPVIMIANEFFDALPVRQFERRGGHWHERQVGLDPDRSLILTLGPPLPHSSDAGAPWQDAADGAVIEQSPACEAIIAAIAQRIATSGGGALVIDYGHARPGVGDTLQAVRGHRYAGVFETPGDADLTAHVDFARLAECAAQNGATAHGPMEMGAFLRALGIEARAATLKKTATEQSRRDIDAALHRLTDPAAIGSLFKVLALSGADGPAPAPFDISRPEHETPP